MSNCPKMVLQYNMIINLNVKLISSPQRFSLLSLCFNRFMLDLLMMYGKHLVYQKKHLILDILNIRIGKNFIIKQPGKIALLKPIMISYLTYNFDFIIKSI